MTHEKKSGMLANLIIVMIMSSSLAQALYTSFFMTQKLSITIFLTVIPLTLLFYVMFKNQIATFVTCCTVILLVSMGVIYMSLGTEAPKVGNNLFGYFTWFIDTANGLDKNQLLMYYTDSSMEIYRTITIIAITFLMTLFVYIFSLKIYNFYILSILLLSVFFFQLLFQVFISKESFMLFMFSFLLFYFLDTLNKRSNGFSYDFGSKLKYLFLILPVCFIVIVVSLFLPFRDNRIAIPFLDTKFDGVFDGLFEKTLNYITDKDISSFNYFSVEATGFGESGRLGGNIDLSNNHVLNVKTDHSNLYLRATSKAFYNGHGWYDTDKTLTPYILTLDSYYIQNQLSTTGNTEISIYDNSKYSQSANAEIEFVNLKTKSLFMPTQTKNLTFNSVRPIVYNSNGIISSSNIQRKKFKYTVEYYNLMLNSDLFKNEIRKSHKGYINNKLHQNYVSNNASTFKPMISDTINIYEKYTQLPEIPQRVRQLAQDLTKNKYNSYDKAKAVETYLSKTFPYSLKPGNVPTKSDFVDYFVFTGKKGYCSYYASAMTVLLRCVDIPARYVEGYILPPEKENGIYKVTNQQAHAWVEVFFDGFGWIPFEPTGAFSANLYSNKALPATISSDMLSSGYNSYREMMEKYRNKGSISYVDIDADSTNKTANAASNSLFYTIVIIIVSVLGAIVLVCSIIVLCNRAKLRRTLAKISSCEANNSVLMAYSYILKLLNIHRVAISPGETPSQFGERIEKNFDFAGYTSNQTNFAIITNYYLTARYSKVVLSEENKKSMLEFIDVLYKYTAEKLGFFKYFIAVFLLRKA